MVRSSGPTFMEVILVFCFVLFLAFGVAVLVQGFSLNFEKAYKVSWVKSGRRSRVIMGRERL